MLPIPRSRYNPVSDPTSVIQRTRIPVTRCCATCLWWSQSPYIPQAGMCTDTPACEYKRHDAHCIGWERRVDNEDHLIDVMSEYAAKAIVTNRCVSGVPEAPKKPGDAA